MKKIIKGDLIIEIQDDANLVIEKSKEPYIGDIEKDILKSDMEYMKCLLEIQGGI